MTPEQKNRLFILFTGQAAETLTAEEHAELQETLRHDAEARRLWFVHQDVEAGIRARAAVKPEVLRVKASQAIRWLPAKPLTAAAAGLVFGLFSASLVFGLVTQSHPSVLTLLKESFEDTAMVRESGVPTRTDVWSGDLRVPQEATSEVKPAEGSRMASLPLVTTEKRRLSYAYRFIDVSKLLLNHPEQSRQIEVSAKFHCEKPGIKDRLQVRLAAFAEDVSEAREIWMRDDANEQALMHVSKTVRTDPDVFGWNTVHAVIDMPRDVKVLLISLAAGVAHGDKSKVDHYLDDVQVRLITSDAPLP